MTPAPRWTKDPNMDAVLESLIPQAFYEIIWTDDSRRTDRRSVFSFMARDNARELGDQTVWNGRPTVGTQTMPTKNILALRKLDESELAGKKREDVVVVDVKAPAPPEQGEAKDPGEQELRQARAYRDVDGWKVYETECSNRQPHAPHLVRRGDASRESRWRMTCPGREVPDLTSGNKGAQWQAQMEDFLASARGAGNEAMRMLNMPQGMRDPIVEKQVRFRVGVAQAHATAALALAIVNSLGDLEPVLAALTAPGTADELEGEERFVGAATRAWRATQGEHLGTV